MDEVSKARAIFICQADSRLVNVMEAMVAAGTASWRVDPEVTGVVGLVQTGTNKAHVVVYLDDEDFETSGTIEADAGLI